MQKIDLQLLNLTNASAQQATALWKALAALPKLQATKVCTLDDEHAEGGRMNSQYPFFFESISLLTQIR